MKTDNILTFVKMGLAIKPERKQYLLLSLFSLIATILMGLIPGIVLGKIHLVILIILSILSTAEIIVIAILSSKSYTIRNRLVMQTVIYFGFILTISLLEMSFGILFVNPVWVIITYIPALMVPVISGLNAYKQIRKDSPYSHKKFVSSRLKVSSFIWGIIGLNFAAVFRDVNQGIAIIILLVIFTILNSIFSFGLLSIQRLYYANKLLKSGICIDDE